MRKSPPMWWMVGVIILAGVLSMINQAQGVV